MGVSCRNLRSYFELLAEADAFRYSICEPIADSNQRQLRSIRLDPAAEGRGSPQALLISLLKRLVEASFALGPHSQLAALLRRASGARRQPCSFGCLHARGLLIQSHAQAAASIQKVRTRYAAAARPKLRMRAPGHMVSVDESAPAPAHAVRGLAGRTDPTRTLQTDAVPQIGYGPGLCLAERMPQNREKASLSGLNRLRRSAVRCANIRSACSPRRLWQARSRLAVGARSG